jgi:choline-glycine betaine transporter
MQMIQFITMNAQAIYIIAMDCPYPKPLTIFYLCYIISLFTLFFRFYIARWSKGSGKKGSKHAKSL